MSSSGREATLFTTPLLIFPTIIRNKDSDIWGLPGWILRESCIKVRLKSSANLDVGFDLVTTTAKVSCTNI